MNKELIKQWGENTAYSAKSHFKSADLKRIWITSLIIVNIMFAVFSILELGYPLITKIFAIISLTASVLLVVYESREGKSTIKRHMNTGDEYLQLHYELQELYHKETISEDEFNVIKKNIKKINELDKPVINQIGKRMAKKAIEKKGEMTKWWKS